MPKKPGTYKKKKSLTAGLKKGVRKTQTSLAKRVESAMSKGKVPKIAGMVTAGRAGTVSRKAAGKTASKAARKTGKVAKKAAGALLKGAAAGAAAKRKTSSTKKSSGPTRRNSIGSSIGKDGYRPRRNQRSRAPYQETDTGPGLMTATGSKTRKKKPSVRRKK
jgi:hypothetical protein